MKVLVVGAGISGLATSLVLSRRGIDVDLVERSERVEALGSGITLIGPALRALSALGVYDDCLGSGFGITEFETRDLHGRFASRFRMPSPVGTDQPGMLGMTRPALHRVLLRHAVQAGVSVRTAIAPALVENAPDRVEVVFNDDDRRTYDLVIGADGVHSTVRELVFGHLPLEFQGQGTLRVVLPRPADVTTEVQYHNAGEVFVGFTPTGPDSMYMYCSFPVDRKFWPHEPDLVALALRKTEPFGGLIAEMRPEIRHPRQVNFTKFETILVPDPWYRGRTLLVGDAAHCPTPQLAAGAAMCLEDAVALGEELASASTVGDGLRAFSTRRFDRCEFVVETASLLCHWQTHPGSEGAEHERVTAEAFERLAEPF